MDDVRTLCPRCRANYLDAGYRLRLIPGRYRQPCDLCGRPGMEFVMIADHSAEEKPHVK